jgi:hypothetical protein
MASSSNTNITHLSGKTLIAINSSQFSLKLTPHNYPTWHAQTTPILRGHNLMGYVDGTLTPPAKTIQQDGKEINNPDDEFWCCQDQLILAAIFSSTHFSVMHTIANAETSAAAWAKFQTSFANKSAARVLSLREKLSTAKRETRPVNEYLQFIKTIADELSLCGSPVSDVDLVVHVLNGLGQEFRDIAAAVHARDTVITFDELQDKLLAHELYLKRTDPSYDPTPMTANHVRKSFNNKQQFKSSGPGNSSSSASNNPGVGSSFSPSQGFKHHGQPGHHPSYQSYPRRGSSFSRIQCQLCEKPGHSACQCFRGKDYFRELLSQPQADYANTNPSPDNNWILDTGASHHVTI